MTVRESDKGIYPTKIFREQAKPVELQAPLQTRKMTVILIRHGEQIDSTNPQAGLTENGKKYAREFGKMLGERLEAELKDDNKNCVIIITHSVEIERTKDTGKEIGEGLMSVNSPHLKVTKPFKDKELNKGAEAMLALLATGKIPLDTNVKKVLMRTWHETPDDQLHEIGAPTPREVAEKYFADISRKGERLDQLKDDGPHVIFIKVISEPDVESVLDYLLHQYKTHGPVSSGVIGPVEEIDHLEYIQACINKGDPKVEFVHGGDVYVRARIPFSVPNSLE